MFFHFFFDPTTSKRSPLWVWVNTMAFVVGPEIMMRFTVTELRKRGVPRDQIYLSMERNMQCAVGFCGHCQFGNRFVCRDGAVFAYDDLRRYLVVREV